MRLGVFTHRLRSFLLDTIPVITQLTSLCLQEKASTDGSNESKRCTDLASRRRHLGLVKTSIGILGLLGLGLTVCGGRLLVCGSGNSSGGGLVAGGRGGGRGRSIVSLDSSSRLGLVARRGGSRGSTVVGGRGDSGGGSVLVRNFGNGLDIRVSGRRVSGGSGDRRRARGRGRGSGSVVVLASSGGGGVAGGGSNGDNKGGSNKDGGLHVGKRVRLG
ncbi:hypothetical protein BCR44DRAFT_308526 [Catenaria anguillulae PL171]|uniref:Uncharacterized protein n=1 Tax=Catenaria anguillulae PL171 TaxID=765915 RepID=A0A1Y2HUE8_9FUNG|nr:hypothetical protein BCR44DRAFT_308526 [Catenaria anguillulae PL171]